MAWYHYSADDLLWMMLGYVCQSQSNNEGSQEQELAFINERLDAAEAADTGGPLERQGVQKAFDKALKEVRAVRKHVPVELMKRLVDCVMLTGHLHLVLTRPTQLVGDDPDWLPYLHRWLGTIGIELPGTVRSAGWSDRVGSLWMGHELLQ